jgi:hypothetical protein
VSSLRYHNTGSLTVPSALWITTTSFMFFSPSRQSSLEARSPIASPLSSNARRNPEAHYPSTYQPVQHTWAYSTPPAASMRGFRPDLVLPPSPSEHDMSPLPPLPADLRRSLELPEVVSQIEVQDIDTPDPMPRSRATDEETVMEGVDVVWRITNPSVESPGSARDD